MMFKVGEAMYGIDWNAPFSVGSESVDTVVVPVTDCPLSPSDMAQLHLEVNPHAVNYDDYGISQYMHTVDFIQSRIVG